MNPKVFLLLNLVIYSIIPANTFFEIKEESVFHAINDRLYNSLPWVARMEWQWLGSPGQTNTN